MSMAAQLPSWRNSRLPLLLLFTLLVLSAAPARGASAVKQNPRDNFCRRYGHQTTVIDDKLYIDGGFVDFDTFPSDHNDYPNTWLGFHDLNNLTIRNGEAWPDLNISLSKDPNSIPTVQGGVLWGDSVNKRFYVFGGEDTGGYAASDFHLLSYDILYDRWDDFGQLDLAISPNIASYGAGIGISETGKGYYYGGWISNASMHGWSQNRTMSSSFYKFDYDLNKTTLANSPDNLPRAEGAMTWIPAGDTGLLVYLGGIVSPYGNGSQAPQPLDKIFVYDPSTNAWYAQTATGEIPQNRRQFCMSAAWAPDKSSYNIYLWGGASVPPPTVNVAAFNDVYILSLPSFVWVKVFPDHDGNATYQYGHYAASCNMVKSNTQMFVIGGTYPNPGDASTCDLASDAWAQHNLWTGTTGNIGNNDTYWALYNPNVTSVNVVPVDVYTIIGGDKNGGATMVSPKSGYDIPHGGLQTLLTRKPTFAVRTPSRAIPTSTGPPTPSPSPPASSSGALSTGAIVGIVVGAVALCLIIAVWCIIGRRVNRRREQRRQSRMFQATHNYAHDGSIVVSPQMTQGPWGPGSSPVTSAQQRHNAMHDPEVQAAELDVQRRPNTSPGVPSELSAGEGPK